MEKSTNEQKDKWTNEQNGTVCVSRRLLRVFNSCSVRVPALNTSLATINVYAVIIITIVIIIVVVVVVVNINYTSPVGDNVNRDDRRFPRL